MMGAKCNGTVLAASTRALNRLCLAKGILIPQSFLADDTNGRLSIPTMVAAWDEAERQSGDPLLGVRAVALTPLGAFGALDFLCLACDGVPSALDLAVRYLLAANPLVTLSVTRWSRGVVLEMFTDGVPACHHHRSVQYTFGVLLSRLAEATGEACVPTISELSFSAAPAAELRRTFGEHLRLQARHDRLFLDRATLDREHRFRDARLRRVLEAHVEEVLAGSLSASAYVAECRMVISRGLDAGDATLETIARQMLISPRGLQRRLLVHGTSFRRLVDDERYRRAAALLSRGATQADVAHAVGLSGARAFRRAYRRWVDVPRVDGAPGAHVGRTEHDR